MNPRDTARKLVELAANDRTPEKERAAAAIKAIKFIREHDLLKIPSKNETTKKIQDVLSDPDVTEAFKAVGWKIWEVATAPKSRRRR